MHPLHRRSKHNPFKNSKRHSAHDDYQRADGIPASVASGVHRIIMQADAAVVGRTFSTIQFHHSPYNINSEPKGLSPLLKASRRVYSRRLSFFFPKMIDDQTMVVAKFNALPAEIHRLEAIGTYKLNGLAALKQSLLHQAFNGEL
ncbi:restriction endonuclease subunit S [Cyanobium sp. Morenito 9A2]|uniref:restriction endonuclease subunit S n=1 Tax=Cyanobium sp. Morenito 9A2 TaxID=2823718 RepID=UPI0020CEFA54|nr:hypothetical protein [Cyanobium sp. Morenito 9A2]MCP9850387.1 hypothetical protein [Cyanobium sp. Morenito 9A2]